ncbi:MAG TPA: serine/threonine-protein kinase, partial [Planctomycetota bacterium]|nr:serine/threonine-protein kinase [Planctomycetota bacterium]
MAEDDVLGLFKELFGEPKGSQREASAGALLERFRIPGYEVLGLLGKGGMGVVLKARQTSLDRMVALKLMSAELSRDPEYVQRFLLEARTAGRLRHLNIVSALDCGVVKESRFMVMEMVEGHSLDQVLKERGMLDERVALGIIKQVAEGLEYAWKHGIIHRDIKPQNIM